MNIPAFERSVLIVEDNVDLVIGLQDQLEHDGYQVTIAGTCAEALAKTHDRRFNAVLLDLGLPDGDGLDVLHALHQSDPTLPIIIVTASTAVDKTIGPLSKGAFAYLVKPYNRDELRATLRRAIGVNELAAQIERTGHALAESEDRFRSLVESASDAIVVADQQGYVVSWNRAASTFFGYATEEVVGKPLTILMPIRYRDAHELGIERMRTTGRSKLAGRVIELHGLRKNGEEFPIELSLATWNTHDGSLFSGIIRDISERKSSETQLNRLQRQQALILNQAAEGIYGLDTEGYTTFANPSAAGMLGYRVEELIGLHMHDVLHHTKPDGSPYPAKDCPIYAATHDGRVHRVTEEVFWRKDGSPFPVEYVSTPIREADRIIGAVVVFHDVSERRMAEATIEAGKRRLDLALQAGKLATWEWNPESDRVVWSDNAEALFHLPAGALSPAFDAFLALIHPEDRGLAAQRLTEASRAGADYSDEFRILWPDGTVRWMSSTAQAHPDVVVGSVRMIGTLQCITRQKEAELALRDNQRLLQELTEHITDVLWMTDPSKMQMLYISPGYERIWGRSCASLMASPQSWLDAIHPDDRARVLQDALTKQTLGAYDIRYRIVRPDGTVRWIWDRAFPIRDADGTVYRIAGLAEDITEHRHIERRPQQKGETGPALRA
jgi:PAS domain S-box-containing protein